MGIMDSAKELWGDVTEFFTGPEETSPSDVIDEIGKSTVSNPAMLSYSHFPNDIALFTNTEITHYMKYSAFQYQAKFAETDPRRKQTPNSNASHEILWQCFLPVPSLQESESHHFEAYNGNGGASGAGDLASATNRVLNGIGGRGFDGAATAGDLASGMYKSGAGAAMKSFFTVGREKMGDEFLSLRRHAFGGKQLDPLNSIMYSGSDLRYFQFDYYFIARNMHESMVISNIIRNFQSLARPTRLMPSASSVPMLEHPSLWKVEIRNKIKDGFRSGASRQYKDSQFDMLLPTIGVCVLNGIRISYNNASPVPVFFSDTGAPVEVLLSLRFVELFQTVNNTKTYREV